MRYFLLLAATAGAHAQVSCDLTQLENAVELCAEYLGPTGSRCEEEAEQTPAEELEEEALLHFGFFLLTMLLVVGFLGGYVLENKHFHYVHEAGGHLLIGVFCGLGLNILFGHSPNEKTGEVRERQSAMISVAKFDTDLFFLLLLPPIIFEAGYNMQRRKFFANLGAICCYAFIGTAVSAVIIAAFVYYAGQLGTFFGATAADDGFNGLESLIFGSLISATDPVTVLAIFGAMKADLDLYSLVFGESVLNDAVAIVLYRTLDEFNPAKCGDNCEVSMGTVTGAVGNFLVIFLGSTAIGVAIGLFSALLYKHTRLYEEEFEALEMVLLILFPYMSWMLAEAMKLSGIVSILFCGIIMAHYTTRNLHPKTEAFSRKFFKIFAFGCESFVFVYMGLAMFTYEQDWRHFPIIVVSIVGMLVSRIFNIVPNTALINCCRRKSKRISPKFQKILWFSGLRGAIAFALALQAAEGYKIRADTGEPGAGQCILTTTLCIVLFTVLSMGGSIYTVLTHFDSPDEPVFELPGTRQSDSEDEGPPPMPPPSSNSRRGIARQASVGVMGPGRKPLSKLLQLDRTLLMPFFTWCYQSPAGEPVGAQKDPRWSPSKAGGLQAKADGQPRQIQLQDVRRVEPSEQTGLISN